jgi:hypothetical protein
MDKTIAVENNLSPVMRFLSDKGFKVEGISVENEYGNNLKKYDALVVAGMSTDILGIQDKVSDIPVINADGLTPEEIYSELNSRFE